VRWIDMRWIRPQNVITSVAGEKRPPRGPVRPKQSEKKFLQAVLVEAIILTAALHCGIHRSAHRQGRCNF
jgi:hypothetical protein